MLGEPVSGAGRARRRARPGRSSSTSSSRRRSTRSSRRLLPPRDWSAERSGEVSAPWLARPTAPARFLPPEPERRGAVPPHAEAGAARRDPRRARARHLRGPLPAALGAPGARGLAVPARRPEQPAPHGARRGAARADPRPQRPHARHERAGTAVELWPADLPKQRPRTRAPAQARAGRPACPIARDRRGDRPARQATRSTPVIVRQRVTEDQVDYLYEHQDEFPGCRSPQTYLRQYPHGSLAAQVLGYVGEISPEQLKADAQGRLPARATRSARRASRRLRQATCAASPGRRKLRVDSLGRPRSDLTLTQPPQPGNVAPAHARHRAPARRPSARSSTGSARARDGAVGGATAARSSRWTRTTARSSRWRRPDLQARASTSAASTAKALDAAGSTAKTAAAKNYPALNRAIAGALPAGLDVQAGDRARRDAGAPALAVLDAAVHRRRTRSHGAGLPQLGPVRERADDAADGARRVVRHVLLPARRRVLQPPARPRPPAPALGEPLRLRRRRPASTSAPRRPASCRRRSGGSRRTRRRPTRAAGRSTGSGSRATRSSSRSARRTCS